MSSSSDHDMSDSCNSPPMYVRESPHSSPSQQVPQLTTSLHGLTCADNTYQFLQQSTKPFLRIIENPQDHFRFRYVSEMVGTHGCLLGKSNGTNKTKTHPTVELVNYSGEAIIRCRLAQHNNPDEHPHKLLEEEQDRDVSYRVPENGSYKVGFAGMGIIHTAKKDVPGLLVKKFSERYKNTMLVKDLRAHCENIAKTINLNIVRLRFSAHDPASGSEICDAVFSEPIHNMKSAATNDLKICRISRASGRPSGGEDVFILVEKVNKKNIMIRLFEMDENGERTWSSNGSFMQSDVHHQYAIVFRTPPYKDPRTPVDVQVYIELVRPSDGRTSEPKEFKYKAEQVYKKKRKMDSSYSSIESSSSKDGSITAEIPLPVFNNLPDDTMEGYRAPAIPQVGVQEQSFQFECDLGSALYPTPDASPLLAQAGAHSPQPQPHPHPHPHPQQPHPPILDLKLNSADFEKLLQNDTDLNPDDIRQISNSEFFKDYVESYNDILPDSVNTMSHGYTNSMEFIHSMMYTDSGRAKGKKTIAQPKPADAGVSTVKDGKPNEPVKTEPGSEKKRKQYPAFYKTEDGIEVKKLVTELCQIIRNKNKKQDVRNKLERLFELRLSNGDTFLQMTLCSNPSSLEYIVKIINSVKMTHLLDHANDKQQTVLHLAVANDMPRMVALLVAKGSNPMAKDHEEQNAVHYAVKYQACLEVLLDAIKQYNVPCDLNDCNNEKQSPLHLAAIIGCARSTRLLLQHGAGYSVRDTEGRTPLHLAAYDNQLHVTRALLDVMPPGDVDVTDGRGNTALQIVCGGSVRENTIEIAKLLLLKKADPLKQEDHNSCAWRLARSQPELRDALRPLLQAHSAAALLEDDVKSEPEDEYESADEGDLEAGLSELALYGRELAALLDASGGWRALAGRVRLDSLLAWYRSQPSPATTLLNHLKDSRDDITSKSLALILDDIGYPEAANVIRRYIN